MTPSLPAKINVNTVLLPFLLLTDKSVINTESCSAQQLNSSQNIQSLPHLHADGKSVKVYRPTKLQHSPKQLEKHRGLIDVEESVDILKLNHQVYIPPQCLFIVSANSSPLRGSPVADAKCHCSPSSDPLAPGSLC